jgi:hypothetical protein
VNQRANTSILLLNFSAVWRNQTHLPGGKEYELRKEHSVCRYDARRGGLLAKDLWYGSASGCGPAAHSSR